MEETISLKDIFQTLKRRLKLIVIVPIIAVLISALISYFLLTPIYQSSTQILVNQSQQQQGQLNQSDIRTNIELINTYNVIIKSPIILDKVIEEANLTDTYEQLNSKVRVASENNSQIVNITVEHEQPSTAAHIANTIATVFQREIATIMNVDNVSILSVAQVGDSPSPIKPNPTLNMAIAFVVGLMTAIGIAFLLEYLDTTVKTENDIEHLIELPILGVIPRMDDVQLKRGRN